MFGVGLKLNIMTCSKSEIFKHTSPPARDSCARWMARQLPSRSRRTPRCVTPPRIANMKTRGWISWDYKMKRILLVPFTVILITTGAWGQEERGIGPGRPRPSNPLSWSRYTVKGEDFSVTLPAPPSMTTIKKLQTRTGKTRMERQLNASGDGVLY